MRNHYESEIGHFKNAICPDVDTFRDSLEIIEDKLKEHKEDKNLLMYCTGGIRCEKASSYLIKNGFKLVIYANQLLRAAYPAMQNVAKTILQKGRALEVDKKIIPIKEIINLIKND